MVNMLYEYLVNQVRDYKIQRLLCVQNGVLRETVISHKRASQLKPASDVFGLGMGVSSNRSSTS